MGGRLRLTRWILIALLMIGGALSSDADERKASQDFQAERFERLLKQRPTDPTLHYNLGTVRYQQGHYDKAAESLSSAVASSGSSLQGRASYNLGNAHSRLGRAAEQATPNQAVDFYQKALEDYRFAIRQEPKDVDAKYNYELVEQRLKALKTQQEQQSAKVQQQKANQQSAQAQTETTQQAQSQQQTEQAGESQQQPQQAASAESKSAPESTSSTEAAQGTEPQQQERQAQALRQQPGQPGAEHDTQAATEPQNMSQQQALWILDTLKNEERGALVKEHQGPAQEPDVDQDW